MKPKEERKKKRKRGTILLLLLLLLQTMCSNLLLHFLHRYMKTLYVAIPSSVLILALKEVLIPYTHKHTHMHKPSSCLHFPLCLSLSDIYNVTAICENRSMIDHEASLSQGLKKGWRHNLYWLQRNFFMHLQVGKKASLLHQCSTQSEKERRERERERRKANKA